MKHHFESLYKYNHWSNEQLIALILKHPESYTERVQTLIGHILNTHHVWKRRLQRIDKEHGVWDIFKIKELSAYNLENFKESMYVLERFDFEYLLTYVNTVDETHTTRVKDILFHIINHSTYHRGQLMTELKQNSATPISLDFSYFKGL